LLPSAEFLLSGKFPDIDGTIRCSDSLSSISPRSVLRCLAIPRLQAVDFVSPIAATCRTTGLEFLARAPAGIIAVEMTGPPKFLGNLNVHLLMLFDPGRTT